MAVRTRPKSRLHHIKQFAKHFFLSYKSLSDSELEFIEAQLKECILTIRNELYLRQPIEYVPMPKPKLWWKFW
jgi:hypothetical protein